MKKQAKVAAVVSAAALMTLGASVSAFAATGWSEEDGTWYYYNKDGNRAEDEWKKSGDQWYWLDGENSGAMATEALVEDDGNFYYVDADGVMVRNTWVKLPNAEQDDDEDPAEYNYYYFQANGKAYKASSNGSTSFKSIDGKKYAFDEDGKMLYGWVNGQSERLTGDTDWNANSEDEDIYYLGDWEDGAMKTGWQKLTVCDDQDDDEEKDFWFWFKSNGKKYTAPAGEELKDNKTINGKKYGFDARGVMAYSWALATTSTSATDSNSWRYFSNPEDGARVSKGWFKVIAPNDGLEDNTFKDYDGTSFAATHADDEEERWYYADKNGILYQGEIKKIKGNYYGFWPEYDKDGNPTGKGGAMLYGLCALEVKDGKILNVYEEGMDLNDMMDCLYADDDKYLDMHVPRTDGSVASLYYFGDEDTDGIMRTGASTITVSGIPLAFEFAKSGGAEGRGRGLTGIKDGKYIYKFGYKVTADADEKYRIMYATGNYKDESSVVYIVDTDLLRAHASTMAVNRNDDAHTVHYVGTMKQSYIEPYILGLDPEDNVYYLINTSGSIIKNKSALKDGYDWYYYVDDKRIKMYTDTKDLKGDTKDAPVMDLEGNVLKDDWKKVDIVGEENTPNILEIMRYLGDRSGLQDKLLDHLGDFQ